jgi:hypothetical protein
MRSHPTTLQIESLERLIAPAPMAALPAGVVPAVHVLIPPIPRPTGLTSLMMLAIPDRLRDALLSQADGIIARGLLSDAHPGAVDPSPELRIFLGDPSPQPNVSRGY